VEPGHRVAIVGPGAVGLCALCAAMSTVDDVAVFGLARDAAQLELARELGASAVVDVARCGAEHDERCDVVIETAGHPAAVVDAIRFCRPGGTVVCVGLPAEAAPIDTAALARAEKRIVGVRAYEIGEWATLPESLAAAGPRLSRLVTHTLALDDIAEALELVTSRAAVKVVMSPDG
jgi:threonine dehydrogenase-like Zn-dependent dehydrogenase